MKTTDIDKFVLTLAGGRFAFKVDITFLKAKLICGLLVMSQTKFIFLSLNIQPFRVKFSPSELVSLI